MEKQYLCIIFQLVTIFIHCKGEDYATIVTIPNLGQVGGLVNAYPEDLTKFYFQYKGINYAEPPDRFTLAEAKLPWSDIHNGKIEGTVCPQIVDEVRYTGDVDEHTCLVLTVTTPQDPNNIVTNLPVLVFFHGGAFVEGTSQTQMYDPELLVHEYIIVVQIQYRLGILGWFTDGSIIPKNIGLKDCFLGLQWVRNYIAAFGGDPNRVTIYGESAGAVITANIWQAPKALGYFDAAVLQSGTAMNSFGFQTNPTAAFNKYVSTTACAPQPTPEAQVNCLKSLPQEALSTQDTLYLSSGSFASLGVLHGLGAGVVLEDANDPDAFVTMYPVQRLTYGELPGAAPVLISITSEEILTFEFLTGFVRIQDNKGLVPDGMQATNPDEVGREVKIHYGGSELTFPAAPEDDIVRYGSDLFFNISYRKFIELLILRNLPVYCMMFDYASTMGLFNRFGKVGHADDLFYIWKMESIGHESLRQASFTQEEYTKRLQIVRFIANFAKTYNPTPYSDNDLENFVWPLATDPNNVQCLDFRVPLCLINNPKQDGFSFWGNMYTDFGQNPITFG